MSLDDQSRERLGYLLTVFSEGGISADEVDELNQLLIAEPEARAFYFSDIGLQLELRDEPLASSISQELRLQERPSRHSSKRQRRRRHHVPIIPWVAGAIAALLCVVVYSIQQPNELLIEDRRPGNYVQVLDYQGSVHVDRAQSQVVRKRQWYAPGTTIFVQQSAQLRLRYADQTRVAVRGVSEIELRETPDSAKHVYVKTGLLSVQVAPQEKPFEIHTPFAQVTVRGTSFTMRCEAAFTSLHLIEGHVRFYDKQRQQWFDLKSGDRMSTEQGQTPVPIEKVATAEEILHNKQADVDQAQCLVRYRFDEGTGAIIKDTAQFAEALDLHIHNPNQVDWITNKGIRVKGLAHIMSQQPADKILSAIQRSNAFTIILQVRAQRLNQDTPKIGMDRILTISQDYKHRNISVGVGELASDPAVLSCRLLRARGSEQKLNGLPAFVSKPLPQLRRQQRMLIIVRKSVDGSLEFMVDGDVVGSHQLRGSCAEWYAGYHLALAQEIDPVLLQRVKQGAEIVTSGQQEERIWYGEFYHIEMYDQNLSATQLANVLTQQGLE